MLDKKVNKKEKQGTQSQSNEKKAKSQVLKERTTSHWQIPYLPSYHYSELTVGLHDIRDLFHP